jgi:RNA polymerase sigma factor (sigma-70 family)
MDDSQVVDELLERYLSAPESDESEELGELLSSRAEPIIRKVVFWRINDSRADAEDVSAEAMLNLVQHLRRYREEEGRSAIQGFNDYVAATAHHACDRYFRRRNPGLWRMRNRVRYVLEHDTKFAVWQNSQGVWLCGLAIWKSQQQPGSTPSLGDLAGPANLSLNEVVSCIFRSSGTPLELNAVVELARITNAVPSFFGESSDQLELADKKIPADVEIEQRTFAAELWKEIQELPPRQRQALLFNLKDDAMKLLLLTGVASFKAVASTLEIAPEELASFWNKLPFADAEIARRLGCKRQQVINLRMAARKRLANRLAGWR